MKRAFLGNLFILILLNVVIKPLWVLGIDVQVQRILGPGEYGRYFDLFSFAFLFMAFFDFGLNIYNNRRVAREPEHMASYLAEVGTLKLLLGAVVLTSMVLIGYWSGYDPYELKLLSGTGTIIFLSSFIIFLRGNISGIHWYRADVLLSVLDRTVAILACGAVLLGFIPGVDMSLELFIGIQIVAYAIAVITAVILLFSKGAKWKLQIDFKRVGALLTKSFPFMLLTLLVVSYHRIDVVMIERMMSDGTRQAGLYAQAYKLLDATVMFAYLFSTLLLPMFSKMIKENEDINELVRLAETLLLVPAAILVVGAGMYAEELMGLLYLEGVGESARAFGTLMFALLPIATTYVYGTLLTAKGDLRVLNTIAAVGAVVNIVGNYYMIQSMGLKGAALMTLITQSVVAVIQVRYAQKKLGLHFGKRQWRNIAIVVIGLPLWCRLNLNLFDDWRIEFVVYLIVAFGLAMTTGLFSIKKLREVLALRSEVE